MYRELLAPTERFEFDPLRWFEDPLDQQNQRKTERQSICRELGFVTLKGTRQPEITARGSTYYLRNNDHLSPSDISELEGYFDFLRAHYGIPEDASVFPKRRPGPAPSQDSEEDDDAD